MIFEDVLLLYTRKGQFAEKQAMNIRDEHRIVLDASGRNLRKYIICEINSQMRGIGLISLFFSKKFANMPIERV